MIFLSLFKLVGFLGGIILTSIFFSLLLRTRARDKESEEERLRGKNAALTAENHVLRKQIAKLQKPEI